MKNIISLLVLAIACILIQSFTPWWSSLIIIGLFTAIMNTPPIKALIFGAFILFAIWFAYAFYLNHQNDGILSERVGVLFQGLTGFKLVLLTGIIGALTGGLSALTGSLFRRAFAG